MKKKIFTIVLTTDEVGKTESLHYAADSSRDVLHVLPAGREVVAITFGPDVEVL